MKYVSKYLFLGLCYLFFCCDDRDFLPSKEEAERGMKAVPIAITLPGGKVLTRSDDIDITGQPTIPGGVSVADSVRVLVYRNINRRGTSGYKATDPTQYKYDTTNERKSKACKVSGNDKVARDTFMVDPDYDYWVIAYAYRKEDYTSFRFSHDKTLLTDKVIITPVIENKEYHAPEFFYGFLHTANDADDNIISGNKLTSGTADTVVALTGTIYRSSGRISVTLTDVPPEVTELSLIVEKYPKTCPLYAVINGYAPYHPIGFPLGDDIITTGVVVQTVRKEDFTSFTAVITADMLRVQNSYLYIGVTKAGGGSTRYMLKSPDYEIFTIYIGIIEVIVDAFRFTIPINFHIKVKGSFNDLTKGNLSIDGESMGEYFEGFLE